jgi:hypothetical protein
MTLHNLSLTTPTMTPTTESTTFITTLHNTACLNAVADNVSMLIIDSGASICITPNKIDFLAYQPSTVKVNDPSSSTTVAGEGLIA